MKSTKDLARELGLIRKRTLKQGAGGSKDSSCKIAQHFSYLIVIDFESTCWKDKRNPSQEIIEFPAVLLNTSTGSIEDEFHTFCLPEEYPTLSAFCTELTGITQDQVESGIPLFLCLKKFSRWLKQVEADKGISYNFGSAADSRLCTFVTWSDWDLGVCLHYECQRKQLLKPDPLKCWIDLRATYRKFYQRVPNGLEGALKDLGIQFEGRQHSGLDDAKNTAHLAWRMICDGCQMRITKNISSGSNVQSAAPDRRQGTSSVTVNRTKVIKPRCQFSNKRKASSSAVASVLQSSTASPDLPSRCGGSGSLPSKACKICPDSHEQEQSKGANKSNNNSNSGSWSKTPRRLKSIPNAVTVPVDKTGPQFKTPGRPGKSSTVTRGSPNSASRNLSCHQKSHSVDTPTEAKSNYRTPDPKEHSVKITPPLCHCGKRSRRRSVFSPGPNQGRTFYSCCGRRRGKLQDVSNFTGGCNFFKWESALLKGLRTSLPERGSLSI